MKRADLRIIVIVLLFVVGVPLMGCVLVGLYAQSILNDLNRYGETLTRDLGVPPHAVLNTKSVCSLLQTCNMQVVFTTPESWEDLNRTLNQVRRFETSSRPSVTETSIYRYSELPVLLAESGRTIAIANSTQYQVRFGSAIYNDEANNMVVFVYHYSAYDDKPFVLDGVPMMDNFVILLIGRDTDIGRDTK